MQKHRHDMGWSCICGDSKCGELAATFHTGDPRFGCVRIPRKPETAEAGKEPTRVAFMNARSRIRSIAHLKLNPEPKDNDRIARWHFPLEHLGAGDKGQKRNNFKWYVPGSHTDNGADRIAEGEVLSNAKADDKWNRAQRRLGEKKVVVWTFVVPSVRRGEIETQRPTNVIEKRAEVVKTNESAILFEDFVQSSVPISSATVANNLLMRTPVRNSRATNSHADTSMSTPSLHFLKGRRLVPVSE